jgi:hypothetical protein
MVKKKVFISFDYDNDKNYKFLLQAWDANPDFDFYFSDLSSTEIKTDDISRVKAALTTKINQATYTLVIIGKDANKRHKDYSAIGYKNWQNFEVAKSKANRNKIVGVKIDKSNESPEEILDCSAKWAMSFSKEAILKALKEA